MTKPLLIHDRVTTRLINASHKNEDAKTLIHAYVALKRRLPKNCKRTGLTAFALLCEEVLPGIEAEISDSSLRSE